MGCIFQADAILCKHANCNSKLNTFTAMVVNRCPLLRWNAKFYILAPLPYLQTAPVEGEGLAVNDPGSVGFCKCVRKINLV